MSRGFSSSEIYPVRRTARELLHRIHSVLLFPPVAYSAPFSASTISIFLFFPATSYIGYWILYSRSRIACEKSGRRGDIPRLPESLLLRMTGTAHRAIRTSTSAGGFPFFLITNHTDDNRRNHGNQYRTDDNSCYIFRKPRKHCYPSCSDNDSIFKIYFVTLTLFVSLVDSLYGLNSM